MATITWLNKIDGLDLNDPQKNVTAADMNEIKSVTNTNAADLDTAESTLASHIANTSNPHSVTKTQVGLSNVDNTADTAKPVSTAQQTALDLKLTKTDDVWGEVPSGTVDGVNDDFTIANSNPSKVALYLDGIRTNPSNFSITGTALTITNAEVIPTNSILIDYIK